MREILFRGKRVYGGTWAQGGIVHQTDFYGSLVDRYFIIDGTSTQDYDIGFEYEVDPATVGEYTGLTDKNGKRIFEGDVCRSDNGLGVAVWVVKYGEFKPAEFYDTYELVYGFRFAEPLFGLYGEPSDGRTILLAKSPYIEVIGNIYDNPELIGGGE